MLVLIEQFIGMPILSLRTGGVIATIQEPIINPNNLRVEAWYVNDRYNQETLILCREDIRDIIPKGMVIDDHDVLAQAEDLVRLKEILEIHFNPIHKTVVTVGKHDLGRVYDYALEDSTYYIKKIYASQRFIKGIVGTDSSIDRTQIVEITDKTIIVRDSTLHATKTAENPLPAPA